MNNSENPNNEEKNEALKDVKKLLVEYQFSVNELQKENQDLIQKNEELHNKLKYNIQNLNNFKEKRKTHTEALNLETNSKITLLEHNLKIQRENKEYLLKNLQEERENRIKFCHKFNQKQAFINESLEKAQEIKEILTFYDHEHSNWNNAYQDLLREYSDVCSDYQRKDEEYNEDLDKIRDYVEGVEGLVSTLGNLHNSSLKEAYNQLKDLKLEMKNKIKDHSKLY